MHMLHADLTSDMLLHSSAESLPVLQLAQEDCAILRDTKSWGLMYWRPSPRNNLPSVPHLPPLPEPSSSVLPGFPFRALLELVGYVDAAYGTGPDLWHSVTGFVFCLASGAVAYKSKLQGVTAVSSTELGVYCCRSCCQDGQISPFCSSGSRFPSPGSDLPL
jgi:hypothetical protein